MAHTVHTLERFVMRSCALNPRCKYLQVAGESTLRHTVETCNSHVVDARLPGRQEVGKLGVTHLPLVTQPGASAGSSGVIARLCLVKGELLLVVAARGGERRGEEGGVHLAGHVDDVDTEVRSKRVYTKTAQ